MSWDPLAILRRCETLEPHEHPSVDDIFAQQVLQSVDDDELACHYHNGDYCEWLLRSWLRAKHTLHYYPSLVNATDTINCVSCWCCQC